MSAKNAVRGGALLCLLLLAPACDESQQSVGLPDAPSDAVAPLVDLHAPGEEDLALSQIPVMTTKFGPGCKSGPFPLWFDPMPSADEADSNIARDDSGAIGINLAPAQRDAVWAPNDSDWNRGTVSKLDPHTMREIARYASVTCLSNKTGSQLACDGQNGCCSLDDAARFDARMVPQPLPPHQKVQTTANRPFFTTIDANGDLYVSNRAVGGQSSVTKIANDPAQCRDHNANGHIETSRDTDGDGFIDTDCNRNGIPDDLADLKLKPCESGLAQEYFGTDDECILYTTNVSHASSIGQGLAISGDASNPAFIGVWSAQVLDALYQIDGRTGLTLQSAHLPQDCVPGALVIDSSGYGWVAANGQGPLCFFDTAAPSRTGIARLPPTAFSKVGMSIDRDQNIWLGGFVSGDAYRYTPDRSNKFGLLGIGWWTHIRNIGKDAGALGTGWSIVADSRSVGDYFIWMTTNIGVARLPGGTLPMGQSDQDLDGSALPVLKMPSLSTSAVDIGADQDLVVVSKSPAAVVRVLVGQNGNTTPPDLKSMPIGTNHCPAGDQCSLDDARNKGNVLGSQPFSTFASRVATPKGSPKASWSFTVEATCGSGNVLWQSITWDADVPPMTTLSLHARSGDMRPPSEQTWGGWTPDAATSPMDLVQGAALAPNRARDAYLQVEARFETTDGKSTPKLKCLEVAYRCL